MQINIGQAKAKWERLLRRVERGEEITIARAGTPVARLVPVSAPKLPSIAGNRSRVLQGSG